MGNENIKNGSIYYTPSIEEFHVGFEFQIKDAPPPEDDWVDEIMSVNYPLDKLQKWINDGEVRVKYLSKEDIESFGFSLSRIEVDSYEWEWDIKDKDGVTIGSFWERDVDDDGELELYGCKFNIKNKSELKKILQQLGCLS